MTSPTCPTCAGPTAPPVPCPGCGGRVERPSSHCLAGYVLPLLLLVLVVAALVDAFREPFPRTLVDAESGWRGFPSTSGGHVLAAPFTLEEAARVEVKRSRPGGGPGLPAQVVDVVLTQRSAAPEHPEDWPHEDASSLPRALMARQVRDMRETVALPAGAYWVLVHYASPPPGGEEPGVEVTSF